MESTTKKDENDDILLSHVRSIMRAPVSECRLSYLVRRLSLQIENQNTFSGFVYDKLKRCTLPSPHSQELTRLEFIRMWKYCILQRSFDVRLRLAGEPPPSYLKYFEKPISVPVPLAQLLRSLGSVRCPYTGLNVETMPPALDEENLPLWAIHDTSVMDRWNQFMVNISTNSTPTNKKNHMLYGVFPAIDDCEGKSIALSAKKVDHGKTSVRGASKIVKISDLLIRICHDELFVDPVCSYDDMFIEFPGRFDASVLRVDYIHYYYPTCRFLLVK